MRMIVETVLSMMTRIFDLKRMHHRLPETLRMHLAYALTLFNLLVILVNWSDLQPNDAGLVSLSISQLIKI